MYMFPERQNHYIIVPCNTQNLEEAFLIIPSDKIAHIWFMMDIKLFLDNSSGASQNKAGSLLFPYSCTAR